MPNFYRIHNTAGLNYITAATSPDHALAKARRSVNGGHLVESVMQTAEIVYSCDHCLGFFSQIWRSPAGSFCFNCEAKMNNTDRLTSYIEIRVNNGNLADFINVAWEIAVKTNRDPRRVIVNRSIDIDKLNGHPNTGYLYRIEHLPHGGPQRYEVWIEVDR